MLLLFTMLANLPSVASYLCAQFPLPVGLWFCPIHEISRQPVPVTLRHSIWPICTR